MSNADKIATSAEEWHRNADALYFQEGTILDRFDQWNEQQGAIPDEEPEVQQPHDSDDTSSSSPSPAPLPSCHAKCLEHPSMLLKQPLGKCQDAEQCPSS